MLDGIRVSRRLSIVLLRALRLQRVGLRANPRPRGVAHLLIGSVAGRGGAYGTMCRADSSRRLAHGYSARRRARPGIRPMHRRGQAGNSWWPYWHPREGSEQDVTECPTQVADTSYGGR